MKKILTIFGVLFFVACSENIHDNQAFIELSSDNIHCPNTPTIQVVELNTNQSWEIVIEYNDEQKGWITLSKNGAEEGKYSISVTVAENDTYEERTAKLIFRAGDASATVNVTQKRKNAILLSQDTYNIDETGGIIDVELKSSVDLSVLIPDSYTSWITPVALRGLNDYKYRFQISKSDITREGYIAFKDNASQLADTVRIYQKGKNDLLKKQRAALMAIFDATNGPGWSEKTNWGSDSDVSQWNGVYVDEEGYVVRLRLNNRGLKGTLPDVFDDLKRVARLDVSGNMLSGKLPASLLNHPFFDQFVLTVIRQSNGYDFDLTGVTYAIPPFNEPNLEGTIVNSETLYTKNKVTALFSFDTKTPNSKLFYPEMCLLSLAYKNKGLEIVGFSREGESMIKGYIANENISMTTTIENCISSSYFSEKLLVTKGTPYIVLVNSEGKVIHELYKDLTELKNVLKKELGEPDPVTYYTSTDFSMDGQVQKLQSAKIGKGVDIVFLGDGFVDKELVADGKWEKAANDAMRHFFSVEPAKSYRDYFNVYAIKKVSENNLFTTGSKTTFSCAFGEGTFISGNSDKCFEEVRKAGIDVPNSSITIILNSPKYAGRTNWWYNDGRSVAFVPMPNVRNNPDEEFREIFIHETIGHGFARLLDEYTTNSGTITTAQKEELATSHANGFGLNLTTDQRFVPWNHFIGLPNYDMVGLFEGGFLYTLGVWRAEKNQTMNNNVPYFNAPSRELFVKRLRQILNEPYSFDDFKANDKYEPVTKARSAAPFQTIPLAPPLVVDGTKR